jgi:hypothetical protein
VSVLLTILCFCLQMAKPQPFAGATASNLNPCSNMKTAPDELPLPRKRINWKDSAGMRFGRWTVVKVVRTLPNHNHMVLCQCDCGTQKEVNSHYLSLGESRSCGCLRNEKTVERSTRHGLGNRGNPTTHFTLYHDILRRCRRHHRYAGRGIVVCDRWLYGEEGKTGLELFMQDMGPRPEGLTVERENNDGPYSPENCVWGTRFDQANNRCDTRLITYKGETLSISRWALKMGVSRAALSNRCTKGWSHERIIETPVRRPFNEKEFWG